MADDRTTKILDTALWRFALQGVHATKTAEIARLAGVGVGTLFRTFPSKEALLQASYEHALQQLTAPLQADEGEARRGEYLHQLLERWWQRTAQAALAYPEAFDLWRLVRTMPRAALPVDPLLGPFAAVPPLVQEALARSPWYAEKGVPLSVLTASLAAQWTAAVDVVLRDHACQANPALRTRVLTQAYQGWWQSLGLSTSLDAAWQNTPVKPRLKPKPEVPLWALLLQAAAAHMAPPPAPPAPRGLGLATPLGPYAGQELPKK
ncbi:TetR/AcrR family transcriptional regulator [Hymenobacter cheonanensis]|uniref:TetR/AcrR family transcriptional regulator n=1 Tax=Hymenobacter sp. CA2-7 TaxID=3063993 RepID=UPI0027140A91|nr:TetR/AcrR family transcriptional regulator [Hymenobacter sp. CA2-7]MDO7888230.1 TetR/AcrR family transcriptional regulator [Hymenobacter sp. CA2-7]